MSDVIDYFGRDPNDRLAEVPSEEMNFDLDPQGQLHEELSQAGVRFTGNEHDDPIVDDE